MLDRANYYATTGGHGACRGCGEVTAIRLVMATNHAIHDKRRQDHIRELEDLIEQLTAKQARWSQATRRARERIDRTLTDAGEAALPLRKRPDRQRSVRRGDRQLHRLSAASTPRPSRSTPTTTRG